MQGNVGDDTQLKRFRLPIKGHKPGVEAKSRRKTRTGNDIEVCLTCDRAVCKGDCERIKRRLDNEADNGA